MISNLGKFLSYTANSLDITSGANDVIVVRHRDGTLHSSPFCVRFGLGKVLRPEDKIVQVEVNGVLTPAAMKMASDGTAYWLAPVSGNDAAAAVLAGQMESPIGSPSRSPTEGGAVQSFTLTPSNEPVANSPIGKGPASPTGTLADKRRAIASAYADPAISPAAVAVADEGFRPTSPDVSAVDPALRTQFPSLIESMQADQSPAAVTADPSAPSSAHRTPPLQVAPAMATPPMQAVGAGAVGELVLSKLASVDNIDEALQLPEPMRAALLDAAAAAAAAHDDPATAPSSGDNNKAAHHQRVESTASTSARPASVHLPAQSPKAESEANVFDSDLDDYNSDYTGSDSDRDDGSIPSSLQRPGVLAATSDAALLNLSSSSATATAATATAAGGGSAASAAPPLRPLFQRTLTPLSADLKKLNLKEGTNYVRFRTMSALRGAAVVEARIYLWGQHTKIVVSDVDGTITKSDVLGHILPIIGRDWTHTGICDLYTKCAENGYQFVYLTARSVSQIGWTRKFLWGIEQEGRRLPLGPIMTAPQRFFSALTQEVSKRSHEFKIACLEDIKSAFPRQAHPFYAGFGNRINDVVAYTAVGIPKHKIFIIDHHSVVHVCQVKQSYLNLAHLVHETFPPLRPSSCVQQEPHPYVAHIQPPTMGAGVAGGHGSPLSTAQQHSATAPSLSGTLAAGATSVASVRGSAGGSSPRSPRSALDGTGSMMARSPPTPTGANGSFPGHVLDDAMDVEEDAPHHHHVASDYNNFNYWRTDPRALLGPAPTTSTGGATTKGGAASGGGFAVRSTSSISAHSSAGPTDDVTSVRSAESTNAPATTKTSGGYMSWLTWGRGGSTAAAAATGGSPSTGKGTTSTTAVTAPPPTGAGQHPAPSAPVADVTAAEVHGTMPAIAVIAPTVAADATPTKK